ncbi:MAG: bifunctional DNA-binding transcriptional regulator/O6-methylguanine-DNA methyltransferase Ada [Cyanobacteria bacterium SZAS LIN-3]|nr:bifunctional DNA-binding transcriptional regulator/O6-methylguanine-DNA methyltransferase Ada [Cyanobacteria bacterium SZAS LIN-3]
MNTLTTMKENDIHWQAVVERDKNFDGRFFYSVKTTGVYCRPSCGARTALRSNVDFHPSCAAAEAAGFRPCKRCKPDQASLETQNAEKIAALCRLIENSPEPLSLDKLAEHAGLSRYHLHRLFKSITGLTPKDYFAAHQADKLRVQLNRSETITEAIFESGYNSNSRFYEKSNHLLGMTPSAFRQGGRDTEIYFAAGQCSLGAFVVAMSDKGICAILLGDEPESLVDDLQNRFPRATLIGGNEKFEETIAAVVQLIENPAAGQAALNLPLDIRGTAFQQKVWKALTRIPAGTTITYSELATRIGAPEAVRAVASACGANALAVAIPCHRVVRRGGGLAGYRWGIERKKSLLDREAGQLQSH